MAYRSEMEIGVNQRRIQSDIVSGVKKGAQMASPAVIHVQIPTMDFKKFSAPLGRITGDLNQFQGALDASIARTLAFGASASVLAGVGASLRGIVQAGIEVEAAMAGINSILQLSSSGLAKFSGDMFDIARNTAQSFKDVSTAALELSRTGLNAEDTLKRLNGAMILSRLTGMDSAVAVKALTAAVNGFSKEGITDIEIVNRLANVETKYAVSARDLADAVSRSGAVAQDAGVSFNELISIVTSVQQQTARGGAVIGNGFKSIFTRIQRAGVREELERIGVATSDSTGSFRGAIPILKDYAKVYQTLSDAEKSSTAEKIAGVFQINTLKATLSDLNKEYSVYQGALDVANGTTDEAITRNEQLNQTTQSLLTNTMTSLKKFGAALSGLAAEEGLRNVLNIVNTVATKMADLMDEDKGSSIAKAIMGGMGKFIAGPGLLMIGKTFFNLLKFLGGQTITVLKQLSTLSVEKEKQQKIEQAIGTALKNNEMAVNKIIGAEGNRVVQEQIILGVIKEQQVAMKQLQAVQAAISRSAASGMFAVGAGGMATTKPKKASGYVPNFAASAGDVISERIAANNAGYEAGRVYNTRIHDGSGGSFQATVNDREKIQTVIGPNGKRGTYVIPPNAGRGFIPNFARKFMVSPSSPFYGKLSPFEKESGISLPKANALGIGKESLAGYTARKQAISYRDAVIDANALGVGAIIGFGSDVPRDSSISVGLLKTGREQLKRATGLGDEDRLSFKNMPIGVIPSKRTSKEGSEMEKIFADEIDSYFAPALRNYTSSVYSQILGDSETNFAKDAKNRKIGNLFSTSVQGGIFEAAVRMAAKGTFGGDERASFDFEENRGASKLIRDIFFKGKPVWKADGKRSGTNENIQSIIKKSVADKSVAGRLYSMIGKDRANPNARNMASGFVPNFAAQTVFQRARKGGINRGAMVGGSLKAISAEQQKLKAQVAIGASDPTLQAIMTTIMSLIKQDGQIDPAEVKAWSDTINFLKAKARNFIANKFPQRLAPTSPKGKIMAGGYVPSFADQIQKTMAFEKEISGQRPIFDTEPFPHVRNASQPTFQSAMNDHGGLRNALRDSSLGQKSAGLASGYVPNFAGAAISPISVNHVNAALKELAKTSPMVSRNILVLQRGLIKLNADYSSGTIKAKDFSRGLLEVGKKLGYAGTDLRRFSREFSGKKQLKPIEEVSKGMGKDEGAKAMKAMGALMAAQSLASYAQQQGGMIGKVGSAAGVGMNMGYMATMMGASGGVGAAIGAVATFGAIAIDLMDSTDDIAKNIEKLDQAFQKNSQASSNYIQKQEEYNSAIESGDLDKATKIQTELMASLGDFNTTEFANKMQQAGGDLKELGRIAAEEFKRAQEEIRSENRKKSLEELFGPMGRIKNYFSANREKDLRTDIITKAVNENRNLDKIPRGLDKIAEKIAYRQELTEEEKKTLGGVVPKDIKDSRLQYDILMKTEEARIAKEKGVNKGTKIESEKRNLTKEKRIETEASLKKREAESFALEIGKIIQSNRRSIIENSSTGGFLSSYEAQTQMQAIDVSEIQIGMKEKASQILNSLEDAFREAKFAEVKPEEAGNLKFLSDAMATFGKNFENLNRGGIIDTSALEAQINLMSFYINKMKEEGQSIENTTATGLEKNKAILEKALTEARALNLETKKQTILHQLAVKNAAIRKNLEAAAALSKGPVAESKDILMLSKSVTDVFSGMVTNKDELVRITEKLDEVVGKLGDGTSGVFGTVGSTSKGTQQIGQNIFAGLKIFEGLVGGGSLPTEKVIQKGGKAIVNGKTVITGDTTSPLTRNERLLNAANFIKKNYEKFEKDIIDATVRVSRGVGSAQDLYLKSFAEFAANAPSVITEQVRKMEEQDYILRAARQRMSEDENNRSLDIYYKTRGMTEQDAEKVRKETPKSGKTFQSYVDEVRREESARQSLGAVRGVMSEFQSRGAGSEVERAIEKTIGQRIVTISEIMRKISEADISTPLANLKGKSEQEIISVISSLGAGQMNALLGGVTREKAIGLAEKTPDALLKNLGSDETNNNLVTIISRTESIIEAINNLREVLTKDSIVGEGSQVSNEFNIGVDVSANDQRWQEVAKKLAESIKELAERSVQDGYGVNPAVAVKAPPAYALPAGPPKWS